MKKTTALRKTLFVLPALIALFSTPAVSRADLVAAWGDNTYGQTRLPAGVNNVKAVAGGDHHSLALRNDGSVIAWGADDQGQSTVPPGLTGVKAIAAGSFYSLALKSDGKVIAWGAGQANVPGDLSQVTAIASGAGHALALKANGTVIAWGNNLYGQTDVPASLSNAIAIAGGWGHSLALRADGSVVAWGNNSYGQTNVPSDLSNVVAIATRGNFNLALKADGTVVAWGYDLFGQTNVPIGLSNVTGIAAGFFHAMALRTDGTIVTWGDNAYGQSALPSGLSNVTAIAAGWYHSLALVPDGPVQIVQNPQSQGVPYTSNVTFSVVATSREPRGYQWYFNGSPLNPDAVRVSGTTNPTLTITNLQFSDIGTYAVAVSNAFGSVISSGASLIVISPPFITQQPVNRTVLAGPDATLSAAASGTPPLRYQWKFNGTDIPDATNASLLLSNVQPAASGLYSMQVTNLYGTVQTTHALLTVTDSPPYILTQPASQMVPIGGSTVLRVSADGSPLFYQWRFNGNDVPGATNTTLALDHLRYDQTGFYNVTISNAFGGVISAKAFVNVIQVFVWTDGFAATTTSTITNVPINLTNMIAVAAGYNHVLALQANGRVATWIGNVSGLTSLTNIPSTVTNVVVIAAGGNCSMALRANGTVVAWGSNFDQNNVPAGLSNVMAIAAGGAHCLAVKTNGSVTGWGNNGYGQMTVPTGLSNVLAVAAGDYHSLALKSDGSVIGGGQNNSGQTTIPTGLSNVIAIAAGGNISLALRSNGTLAAWGYSGYGQTSIPRDLSNVVAIAAGATTCIALKQDGTLVTWGTGFSQEQQPVSLSNVVAVTAGGVVQPRKGFSVAVFGNGTPAFTLHPASQTTSKGANVQLHARATGVQPMNYQWQLENQNLPGATNADLIITNAQGKDTGGYRMIVSNPLGTATSRTAVLAIPYNTNLAASLNAKNLNWGNGDQRSPAWFAQNRETHDGDTAAQSGAISNNQQVILQGTYLSGPGTLTFWWKVSSEESFDFLRFYLNSTTVPLASISGETDWQRMTITIPPGELQTLRWIYSKDSTVSAGRDAGWVDEVVFTPDPPVIIQQFMASRVLPAGATEAYKVLASGLGPFSYQWFKDGASLPGATKTSLVLTNLTRRDSATYRARVSNAGGSVTSSNATLKVIVRQRLGSIRLAADGSIELRARDADGGLLLPQDLPAFEAQASTNLMTWETLPNVLSLTNGALVLRDSGRTHFPVRFYRLVEH